MKFLFSKKYNDLEELVIACQRGNSSAETVFYDRYKSKLNGICLRYAKTRAEADDIFQEAFIRIFKNIKDLKDPLAVDGWVKVIVIRTAINYYHQNTKEQDLLDSLDQADIDPVSNDYEEIMDKMNTEDLLKIINSLPDKYRTVINLSLVDGYSHVEIGEMMSVSEGTIRSQFKRGRNLLLNKLASNKTVLHEKS